MAASDPIKGANTLILAKKEKEKKKQRMLCDNKIAQKYKEVKPLWG